MFMQIFFNPYKFGLVMSKPIFKLKSIDALVNRQA